LTCLASAQGRLQACRVADERPSGLGVGAAAVNVAAYYRLDPKLLAAGAKGETVAVLIRFDASGTSDEPVYQAVAARSPQSLALARDLLATYGSGVFNEAAYRKTFVNRPYPPPGVTSADLEMLADAWLAGARRARASSMEMRAAEMTVHITDAQLREGLAFWRGPMGQAWRDKAEEFEKRRSRVTADFTVAVWRDAAQALCKSETCPEAPMPLQASGASSAPSTAKP
jgi:hypothetical protein